MIYFEYLAVEVVVLLNPDIAWGLTVNHPAGESLLGAAPVHPEHGPVQSAHLPVIKRTAYVAMQSRKSFEC
jgi:hypothetical protein